MELIRHYFGSSSELLSRLFLPPLSKDRLFERWYLDPRTRRMTLELADRMPGTSAEDVARIAASNHAWKAASLIGLSCLQASVAGREVYPQALFPFEGRTRLAVNGKWLSRGKQEGRTFLVYKIRSCWHPFPFETLRYRTKGLTRRFMPPEMAGQPPPPRQRVAESKKPTLSEQDAGSSLSPTKISIRTKSRFPDLESKIVWMSRQIASSTSSPISIGPQEAVDQLAVGEPGSSRRVRSVSLEVATQRESELPPPEFIKDLLEILKTSPRHQITLLTASSDDGWSVPLPLLTDEDGVIDELLLIGSDEHAVPRKACAFLVSGQSSQGVLVAIEAQERLPFWYPLPSNGNADPLALLDVATTDFAAQAREEGAAVPGAQEASYKGRLAMWLQERCGLGAIESITPSGL
jgi:hypothetical protein